MQVTVSPGFTRQLRRWFWLAVAAAICLWLAYLVREIWLPILIALVIAMVLDPVVDRMERRGWSRGAAASVIFVGFFVTLGIGLYFAVPAVVRQMEAISGQIAQYIPEAGNPKQEARARSSLHNMLARAHAPDYVFTAVEHTTTSLSTATRRSTAWLSEHAIDIFSNLIWIVIIPLVTFYALKDFHLILAKALLLVPRDRRDFVTALISETTAIFAKFLRGLSLVSFLNGCATFALLLVLRVPNAFTLGAIAGVLYTVPYVGALMTIVLVAGVSFLAGGLKFMLLVVACNVLLHQVIFDQVISPRILGGHVGLHPILSIIALLAGNVLLGVIGMVLAVPVAACVQMIVVTLVPKLRHEIALPADIHEPPDTVASLSEETKAEQVQRDATEELHASLTQAIDQIEEAAREEQATEDTGSAHPAAGAP